MKHAKTFSAIVKGTFAQIKAYKKESAILYFKRLDHEIEAKDVRQIACINSHQTPVEELFI